MPNVIDVASLFPIFRIQEKLVELLIGNVTFLHALREIVLSGELAIRLERLKLCGAQLKVVVDRSARMNQDWARSVESLSDVACQSLA